MSRHEHDVRAVLAGRLDALPTVGCLGEDLDVLPGGALHGARVETTSVV